MTFSLLVLSDNLSFVSEQRTILQLNQRDSCRQLRISAVTRTGDNTQCSRGWGGSSFLLSSSLFSSSATELSTLETFPCILTWFVSPFNLFILENSLDMHWRWEMEWPVVWRQTEMNSEWTERSWRFCPVVSITSGHTKSIFYTRENGWKTCGSTKYVFHMRTIEKYVVQGPSTVLENQAKAIQGTTRTNRTHKKSSLQAAGLNTVDVYVPWNLHEPRPNEFDFGDGTSQFSPFLNLTAFVEMIQEEDMLAIFRPGPYICGEWEFGGLPSWLLHEHPMFFRRWIEKLHFPDVKFPVLTSGMKSEPRSSCSNWWHKSNTSSSIQRYLEFRNPSKVCFSSEWLPRRTHHHDPDWKWVWKLWIWGPPKRQGDSFLEEYFPLFLFCRRIWGSWNLFSEMR